MVQASTISDRSSGSTESDSKSSRTIVYLLFFACILLPISISLGSLRLTPLRLFLLAVFVPFLIQVLSGKAGRFTVVDGLILFFGTWIAVALMAVHGTAEIPFAGITIIEMVGGYLAGRVLVRNAQDHSLFFRVYFWVLVILAPLAVIELLTSRMIITEALGGLASFGKNHAYRLGMSRVQVAFAHSILWGLFCSIAIGNLFYIYGRSIFSGLPRAGLALGMTYTSLSSGPFLAGLLQVMLIAWDRMTKGKWVLLIVLFMSFKLVIDSLSNRGLFMIFLEEFTFSGHTAWYRIHIWRHGTDEVWRHPIFGIGLGDWQRADWMTGASVDNFWLLTTMRYGLPVIVALLGAIALLVFFILRTKITDPLVARMRVGYLVTMTGLFMTLSTVHVWEQMAVLVMFYIGIGSWFFLVSHDEPAQTAPLDASEPLPQTRFSRTAPKPGRRNRDASTGRATPATSRRTVQQRNHNQP